MMQLRATNERQQRSVARVARTSGLGGNATGNRSFAGFGLFNAVTVATAVLTTAIAWTTKPCALSTAPSMHGKYHNRRLQELLT